MAEVDKSACMLLGVCLVCMYPKSGCRGAVDRVPAIRLWFILFQFWINSFNLIMDNCSQDLHMCTHTHNTHSPTNPKCTHTQTHTHTQTQTHTTHISRNYLTPLNVVTENSTLDMEFNTLLDPTYLPLLCAMTSRG